MVTQDVPDYAQQVAPSVPGTAVSYLTAIIAESTAGASELVAASPGQEIVVCGYVLSAVSDVNVKFQSDGSPDDLTGLLYLAERGGAVVPFNSNGWFRTLAGEALDIDLSGAVAVGGHLLYALVG